MSRIHLLQPSHPFPHLLSLAPDLCPQGISDSAKNSQPASAPLKDRYLLVTSAYGVVVPYTSPRGENKEQTKKPSRKNQIPASTLPNLPRAQRKKGKSVCALLPPKVTAQELPHPGILVTSRRIQGLSLFPQAAVPQKEEKPPDGQQKKKANCPACPPSPPPGKKQSSALGVKGKNKGLPSTREKNKMPRGNPAENSKPRQKIPQGNARKGHCKEQNSLPSAYDRIRDPREKNTLRKGGIHMPDDLKPAALRYAVDEPQAADLPGPESSDPEPTVLQYVSSTEEKTPAEPAKKEGEPTAAAAEKKETSPKGTKPSPYYRIPSSKGGGKKKGKVGKKVTLKVEDLLQSGRSHFEIPKSKQEARKKKAPRRRG